MEKILPMRKPKSNVPMFTVTVHKPVPIIHRNLSKYAAKDYVSKLAARYPNIKITKELERVF
jgi:hypothetical protein